MEYEPLTQQGRQGHWEITFLFFFILKGLEIKINEGKHCSWLSCQGRMLRPVPVSWPLEIAVNNEIQDCLFK